MKTKRTLAAVAAFAGCLGAPSMPVVLGAAAGAANTTAVGVPVWGAPEPAKGWRMVEVAGALPRPWSMAWLPDGSILITGKSGSLTLVENGRKTPVAMPGAPAVYSGGQGGLMDVALHPDFARNRQVYFTLSLGNARENRTALMRGTLDGTTLSGARILYQNPMSKEESQHFGSRLLWLPDGTLLMSIGDGGNPPAQTPAGLARAQVQRLETAFGKVLRLDAEGKPASGNPLAAKPGALAEVWTMGHRNIQGMARDPRSGRIYASEHGARGGDEINLLEAGKNYGWPLATHSIEYWGREITPNRSLPGMVDPLVVWTPSPAPSGLAFYTGDKFPAWDGDLFSGGLVSADVRRVDLDASGRALGQEGLPIGARVRDVRQGPDGYLYVLTDESSARLIRIEPER